MARWQIKLSNLGLQITWNIFFRASYSPVSLRRNFDLLSGASAQSLQRKFPNARFEVLDIGGVNGELISSTPQPKRTILYLHGGGFFMGSVKGYRRNLLRLSYRLNARILVIDYRLAPDHPFPAAVEDAKKAYQHLLQITSPSSIVLGGDSAGGGLVLSTLLSLRDEQAPLPSGAFCLSAWADLSRSGESLVKNEKKDIWLSKRQLDAWAPYYLGAADAQDPIISPVFAGFEGIPPLLLLVGDQEVLLSDTVRVAEKAKAAGVRVQLEVAREMQHAWPLAFPNLPESKVALKTIAQFLDRLGTP